MLGWTVDECDSGYAVLDYVKENLPESILLDIQMPGIDGIEVTKILRQTWPVGTLKIVAYTAHAITEEVTQIRESGFDDLLIKPVVLHDVVAVFGNRKTSVKELE
jgi:CheY-like chemotaxis protein